MAKTSNVDRQTPASINSDQLKNTLTNVNALVQDAEKEIKALAGLAMQSLEREQSPTNLIHVWTALRSIQRAMGSLADSTDYESELVGCGCIDDEFDRVQTQAYMLHQCKRSCTAPSPSHLVEG